MTVSRFVPQVTLTPDLLAASLAAEAGWAARVPRLGAMEDTQTCSRSGMLR